MRLVVGNPDGIPIGPWYYNDWPGDATDWSMGEVEGFPGSILGQLSTAKSLGVQLIVSLAGPSNYFWNPDHTFNMADWKSQIDAIAAVDFDSYIADGTLIANMLIDEPKQPGTWGGQVVINTDLDEMARYSKTYWPTLPTAVRQDPIQLEDSADGFGVPHPGGYVFNYLDAGWIQYAAWRGNVVTYRTTTDAAAERQELHIISGLHWAVGGDGSGPVNPLLTFWYMMTGSEVSTYTEELMKTYNCGAFNLWRYYSASSNATINAYWNDAGVQAGFVDAREMAAEHERRPILQKLI